jgi:carbonic anhydrase
VAVLGVKHVIICGHSDCGAMRALLHPERVKHLPSVHGWLSHAEAARHTVEHLHPDADEETKFQAMIEQNVICQLANLRTHPAIAARLTAGTLAVHGWKYSIETGEVLVYDEMMRRFIPAAEKIKEYTGDASEKQQTAPSALELSR